MSTPPQNPWWHESVFYQVYPLSFSDSDGDGYGDLEGVISKLDYLSDTLGVGALWMSPFYESPMDDWGYDVSNHCAVDPLFGNNGIAERMIDEAHKRGMKVMIDFIANHTSIRHPWSTGPIPAPSAKPAVMAPVRYSLARPTACGTGWPRARWKSPNVL